jgi:hypothetical protein
MNANSSNYLERRSKLVRLQMLHSPREIPCTSNLVGVCPTKLCKVDRSLGHLG